jgi:uncharacterized protein with PIN domain
MKIETLNPKDKIPVNCPKCNTPLNKTYCRYDDKGIDYNDDAFDLKVVKCPECKKAYAYWIDNSKEALTKLFEEAKEPKTPVIISRRPLQIRDRWIV